MTIFKKAFIIIGRLQGITKAHNELIWLAKKDSDIESFNHPSFSNPPEVFVGVVCGRMTSKNKKVNPFTFTDRIWMIRQCHPDIKCLKLSTAYLGDAVDLCYGLGYDLKRLYVGGDREETYRKQIERHKHTIEIVVLDRNNDISGTKFREALLRDADGDSFFKLAPGELHRHYGKIKSMFRENL